MNKTDAEIEKALECCSSDNFSKCEECPLKSELDEIFSCMATKQKLILDYINRLKAKEKEQQEEIERLRKETSQTIESIRKLARDTIRDTKSEAIKEFAERLTDRICENVNRSLDNPDGNNYYPIDVYKDIDNLVKEMTENEGKE